MITLSHINQYANLNNISEDTDIFTILSLMNLQLDTLPDIEPQEITIDYSTPSYKFSFEDVLHLLKS